MECIESKKLINITLEPYKKWLGIVKVDLLKITNEKAYIKI